MQYTHINDEVKLSRIVLGCMRIANLGPTAVRDLIETALDAGINFFDHADIYGGGRSKRFCRNIGSRERIGEKLFTQTKCGFALGFCDFRKSTFSVWSMAS